MLIIVYSAFLISLILVTYEWWKTTKWLKWEMGRQDTGYAKKLLATSKRLKFDFYLLRFGRGVSVPPHTDPAVEGHEHHRINFTIKAPCIGTGVFHVDGPYTSWLNGRLVKFRPDLYTHWMTEADTMWSNESVYMLSFGWLRKK